MDPSWTPGVVEVAESNITSLMLERGFESFADLHRWSIEHRPDFWQEMIKRFDVEFATEPTSIFAGTPHEPRWCEDAELNIAVTALAGAADALAIRYSVEDQILDMNVGELRSLVHRFANGLVEAGFEPGDRIAIAMVMNPESVIAYLGIVLAGMTVVSIADSFAPEEIATRLRIADASAVVTQGVVRRAGRELPMYDKVVEAGADRIVVLDPVEGVELREGDLAWPEFVSVDDEFEPVIRPADAYTNILFSSGTTGEPKAIPWTHLTPLKPASDGFYHQDIHPDDIVAWPTNLGWMMGPWLIYATLINRAAMALHHDAPTTTGFTEFIENADVTIVGTVPSLVAGWRASGALDEVDWSAVRVLTSTGEASNADDMHWLMNMVGAPVIEYCGGTEIGGGYISGTVVQPQIAGTFSTPCVGIDFVILDDDGNEADEGELFVVPPSIGLSETLLNRDHDEVYHSQLPTSDLPLRRHGDQMAVAAPGYWRAMGRVDDTMNLGGIKVSSAEIERVLDDVSGVRELAAIAATPDGGGPSELVIYVVADEDDIELDTGVLRKKMQKRIRKHLNPLFKIRDVVQIDALPRTASAKVMRRTLRAMYQDD